MTSHNKNKTSILFSNTQKKLQSSSSSSLSSSSSSSSVSDTKKVINRIKKEQVEQEKDDSVQNNNKKHKKSNSVDNHENVKTLPKMEIDDPKEKEVEETKKEKLVDLVKKAYDEVHDVSESERKNQPLSPLISMNNFINCGLLKFFSPPTTKEKIVSRNDGSTYRTPESEFNILDMCGGRGQLMKKIIYAKKFKWWCMIDLSPVSVIKAEQRFKETKDRINNSETGATFHCVDCFGESLETVFFMPFVSSITKQFIPKPYIGLYPIFDISVCLMAIHYSFETQLRLDQAIRNLSQFLKVGGFVILTFIDFNYIEKEFFLKSTITVNKCQMVGDSTTWSITLDKPYTECKQEHPNGGTGQTFTFFLHNYIKKVPEHVVDKSLLEQVGKRYGLQKTWECGFPKLFTMFKDQYVEEYKKMNCSPIVDPIQQQIAGLYQCFIFTKKE